MIIVKHQQKLKNKIIFDKFGNRSIVTITTTPLKYRYNIYGVGVSVLRFSIIKKRWIIFKSRIYGF